MEYKDYYKVLGVDRDADGAAIKAAYRRLARKYHPDVNSAPGAEDRFKDLQEAYEVLKDSDKRAAYDQLGANWKAGQQFRPPPGWGDQSHFGDGADAAGFSDFFRNLFGSGGFGEAGGFGFGGHGGFQSSAPQTAVIRIPLEDAYAGASRLLNLQPGNRQLRVKIPKGVTSGQQIRLAGQADGADLLLKVELLPHKFFQLDGRDVLMDLPITPWEAALGAKVKVPTLGGTIELRIPEAARSGQKLRLRGRGLPGSTSGDQIIQLQLANPPQLDDDVRALYRELAKRSDFDPRADLF